jgi:hypothetical protein
MGESRMVNEATENDHAFSIESDIVKLNEAGDRLLIQGYIGELIKICFVEDSLEIRGLEGKLRINLNEEELRNFLNKRRAGNRRFRI